ncbi:MAG: chorismate synthase [Syntrophomonas sp.]
MLKFTTSGESHGKGLIGIIEGLPAGLEISDEFINQELRKRQKGYGRGARMGIETDTIEIFSGVRNCRTLGSPVSFLIRNKDHENWRDIMGTGECSKLDERVVSRPRPGHADLVGAIKYNHSDMRNVLERSSARETACRVAAGAFFKQLLDQFNIYIYSQVVSIGNVKAEPWKVERENIEQLKKAVEESPLCCPHKIYEDKMMQLIDRAREAGESAGGSFEVGAVGVLPGLGSYVSWDNRLDGQLAQLLMSIPAIKAVEIGEGVENSGRPGSEVHDEIYYNETLGIYRKTNRAGGIEGGISNGETLWARAYMKPIPTLYKPLVSVNTNTWCEQKADVERSDICAVPAAAIVGEAVLAFGIARAFLVKFGGDSIDHIKGSYQGYRDYVEKVWRWRKI